MHLSRTSQHAQRMLLLSVLAFAPALGFAALATYDLAGTKRASPPTMGALEVQTVTAPVGVAPPTGLALIIERTG